MSIKDHDIPESIARRIVEADSYETQTLEHFIERAERFGHPNEVECPLQSGARIVRVRDFPHDDLVWRIQGYAYDRRDIAESYEAANLALPVNHYDEVTRPDYTRTPTERRADQTSLHRPDARRHAPLRMWLSYSSRDLPEC